MTANEQTRPHKRPGSIRMTVGSNLAYQYVVHQALVHIPEFLCWIETHRPAYAPENGQGFHWQNTCLKCCYRRLAQAYWSIQNANNPILDTAIELIDIQALAALHFHFPTNTNIFAAGAQNDPKNFFMWVVDTLKYSNQHNVAISMPRAYHPIIQRKWNEEFIALFNLIVLSISANRACRPFLTHRSKIVPTSKTFESTVDGLVLSTFTSGLNPLPNPG